MQLFGVTVTHLKKLIGFGLSHWKKVSKTARHFDVTTEVCFIRGKRTGMKPPGFLETIFGLLDHLKLHNYGGATHPCIDC